MGALSVTRVLRRCMSRPVSTVVALAGLSFGIAITASTAAVSDALLLRSPKHVLQAESVARLSFTIEAPTEQVTVSRFHYPALRDMATASVFRGIAAYAPSTVSVSTGHTTAVANALLVTDGYFDVLGIAGAVGTLRTSFDERTAVVSTQFWRSELSGADLSALQVRVDGHSYRVSGIAPAGFSGLTPRPVGIWLPIGHGTLVESAPSEWKTDRESLWLEFLVRCSDDSTWVEAAQRATAVIRSADEDVQRPPVSVTLVPLSPGRRGALELEARIAILLTALSILGLFLAATNASSLVVPDMLNSTREFRLLVALGAGRASFLIDSATDALVVVLPSCIFGTVLTAFIINSIGGFFGADVPIGESGVDARMLALVAMVGIGTWIFLTGLRWLTSLYSLSDRPKAHPPSRGTYRRAALAGQSFLATLLLVASFAFRDSLRQVESLDLGVDLDRTIQASFLFPGNQRSVPIARSAADLLAAELRNHPSVLGVTTASGSPFTSGSADGPWTETRSYEAIWGSGTEVAYRSAVGDGFFSALGSTLVGRDFGPEDHLGAPRVAILNAPLARRLWPTGDALGQCMFLESVEGCIRVIGVTSGVWKLSALARDRMALYLPIRQVPSSHSSAVFVRFSDGARAGDTVRNVATALDPTLPALRVVPLADVVAPEFRPWRLGATVLSVLAIAVVAIVGVGYFGATLSAVRSREKEVAIRRAIGASSTNVVRTLLGQPLGSVLVGTCAGGLVCIAGGDYLKKLQFAQHLEWSLVLPTTVAVLAILFASAAVWPMRRCLRQSIWPVLKSD